MDDEELVSRALAGDRSAFGELLQRHERPMLALAGAYLALEADTEDAVQEAFLKAFQGLGQLRDRRRFSPWLATIVVNTCRDTLRSKSSKVSLAEFSSSVNVRPRLGQQHLTPATLASKGEEAELLKAAVGRLPEEQRVVLMLRYAEHLPYQRIAAYIGVPTSTVRGRLHNAKKALRKALGTLLAEPG